MTKRIFIAGHGGMVGSALRRQLEMDSNNTIITVNRENRCGLLQRRVGGFNL